MAVLGLGIDLVEVDRVRALLRRWPESFPRKVLSPGEREYCQGRAGMAASVAARFAAKEAALKALGLGIGACRWVEMEIEHSPSGAPRLRLKGQAAARAEALGVERLAVSLSHSREYAVACVLAEGREVAGP